MNLRFNILSRVCLVGIASLIAPSRDNHATGAFDYALLTPGPILNAAWNAGAYEGPMRIGYSLGTQVSHVEAKTRAAFDEAAPDFASRGYRLVFGHGFELQDAAARHSIVAKTRRVPSAGYRPDATPVARP